MAAFCRVERRNTHQTVYALFRLEIAVGVYPVYLKRDRLDACFFAGKQIQHFHLVTATLRIAGVHTIQHLHPVLRFGAACTCVKGKNGVVGVEFARQKRSHVHFVDCRVQRSQFRRRFVQQTRVLVAHGKQVVYVVEPALQLAKSRNLVLDVFGALRHLLGVFDVVPEVRGVLLLVERSKFLCKFGDVETVFYSAEFALQIFYVISKFFYKYHFLLLPFAFCAFAFLLRRSA